MRYEKRNCVGRGGGEETEMRIPIVGCFWGREKGL